MYMQARDNRKTYHFAGQLFSMSLHVDVRPVAKCLGSGRSYAYGERGASGS